jgi:hypothetical protein
LGEDPEISNLQVRRWESGCVATLAPENLVFLKEVVKIFYTNEA